MSKQYQSSVSHYFDKGQLIFFNSEKSSLFRFEALE